MTDHKRNQENEINCSSKGIPNDKPLKQLKRIRGQLDGVIKMYEEGRGCVDIARQILAARNSLGGVARTLLSDEATRCSREKRLDDLDDVMKEFLKY